MEEIIFSAVSTKVDYPGANYPDYKVEFRIPSGDVSVKEYITVFSNFLKSIGFTDRVIQRGLFEMSVCHNTYDSDLINETLKENDYTDNSYTQFSGNVVPLKQPENKLWD